MLTTLLLGSALALDLPAFSADQAVYLSPPELAFSHARVDAAAAASEHSIRVVVFERVIDGHIDPGHASETEDAIEDLAAAWRAEADRTGFRPDEDSILVLALDDREVRVMAAGRWDAELGLHNDALLPVIDEHFLPLARTGDLDGALAATVRGLDERIHYERVVRPQEEAAAARKAKLAAGASGLGGVLLVVFARGRSARAARRRFEEALAQHRERLDHAEGLLAELTMTAEMTERVALIRERGERTAAVWRRVTGELDGLRAGLATLRRHLDEVEAAPKKGGLVRVSPWEAALKRLEDEIELRPQLVSERLFDAAQAPTTVRFEAFAEGLEERFEAAREGWEALCEAAELRHVPARDAVGDLGLAALRRRLDGAALSASWLAGHPLLPDPEAALAALDALRRSDPLAYAEACGAAVERVSTLAQQVADLIEDQERSAAAAADARGAPGQPPDTVVSDPNERPDEGPLVEAQAALAQAIGAGQDFEAVDRAANAVVAAAVELRRRKDQANAAPSEAPGALARAAERQEALARRASEAEARIAQFRANHTPKALNEAWRELSEARTDLAELGAALERARGCMDGRDFVGAIQAARVAELEHGQAVEDLDQLAAALAALEAGRQDALRLMAELDRTRDAYLTRLREWGVPVEVLREGDALRSRLGTVTGPTDYALLATELRAVQSAWSVQAERHLSRVIRQRQAEARAAAEAARAAAYRRASSLSGHTSRSSFSSPSRSTSSSGRSFSSGGHSAGRSFSSGGRSAGRKF